MHAVCLSLGEPFKAGQVGVVHEIGLHVQLIAQSTERDAAKRIVDAGVVFVRGTAVGAIEAQDVERSRIRRGIAHQIARGEAIIVRTTALKGVVQAQIMPHFVCYHSGRRWRRPHGRGFDHDSVERFAVHCRKGRKPHDRLIVLLARDRLHHPNVQVLRRVPMAQGLQIRFLCRHKYIRQFRFHPLNPRAESAFRILGGQAKLNACLHAQFVLVVSVVGEGIVQEFDGIDDESVFDVLRSVVVNDVDHDRNSERFSRTLKISR